MFTAARKARLSTGLSMRARCRLRIAALFGSSRVVIALHTSFVVLRKKVGADGPQCRPRASISSAKASAADSSFASDVTAKRRRSSNHSRTCLAPQSCAWLAPLGAPALAAYVGWLCFVAVSSASRLGTRPGRSSTRASELIATILFRNASATVPLVASRQQPLLRTELLRLTSRHLGDEALVVASRRDGGALFMYGACLDPKAVAFQHGAKRSSGGRLAPVEPDDQHARGTQA